jgi:hypothetical protein
MWPVEPTHCFDNATALIQPNNSIVVKICYYNPTITPRCNNTWSIKTSHGFYDDTTFVQPNNPLVVLINDDDS